MIQQFVHRFIAAKPKIEQDLRDRVPEDYDDLVKRVVAAIRTESGNDEPDPERIHVINDGDYQGTQLYVIGSDGYQPDKYWAIYVDYGSCSGCDSFLAVLDFRGEDDPLNDGQVRDLWTMMLHMVQSMTEIERIEEL